MKIKFTDKDGYKWAFDSEEQVMKLDGDDAEEGGYLARSFMDAARVLVAGYGEDPNFCTPSDPEIERNGKKIFDYKWKDTGWQIKEELQQKRHMIAQYVKHKRVEGLLVEVTLAEWYSLDDVKTAISLKTTEEFETLRNRILYYAKIGMITELSD